MNTSTRELSFPSFGLPPTTEALAILMIRWRVKRLVLMTASFLCTGAVYNVTEYMKFHPGGVAELMKAAGMDGTQQFNEVSSDGN